LHLRWFPLPLFHQVGKDMGRKLGELTVGTQLLGVVAAAQPNPDLPWKGGQRCSLSPVACLA
jgi:hypothetical protein